MADNILTKDRADADLDIAAKEIGGVKVPRNILQTADGVDINPATDETIAAVGAAVSGLLTNAQLRAAPVEVFDPEAALMFLRFFNLFSSPPGYDPALQRLRGTVLVESGTVTTVSTVTAVTTVATVTNQAQIDGVQGRLLAYGADKSAWSDCVRARIT